MIQFFIPGTPKGQPRPKAFSRGGHAGVYDPKTANEWKQNVRDAAKRCGEKFISNDPLELTLNFKIARAKGHYRSGKNSHLLKPNAQYWHVSKPDSDNFAKAVMDALSDYGFWPDDSIVARLVVTKIYTNTRETGCHLEVKLLSFV